MPREIEERLIEAKVKYYEGTPIMDDAPFDLLEDELRSVDPDNSYFSLVGSREQGADIVHKYRMKSMAKGKQPEDVEKWMKNIGIKDPQFSLVLLPKVDGVSATLRYIKGKLVYVASRGDGTTGKDITHIAKHMKDIPLQIDFTQDEIEIRGELYLSKFGNHGITGPLRNNCTGLINRQTDTSQTHHLRFVAYQVVLGGFKTVKEYLTTLLDNGFNVADAYYVTSIIGIYNTYLDTLRDKWEYETDGLVAVVNDLGSYRSINALYKDNDHHWFTNFALKPPSVGGETTLIDIEWQMSRQGLMIPVAIFETITIGGVNIQRATANNYLNVCDLDLKKGDIIIIERANDVIPFLKSNNGGGEGNLIPTVCPHCGSHLEEVGVHLACLNHECEEQVIQRIIYYVREADIDNVAEGMLRAIYTTGLLKTPADLYRITRNDLLYVDGLGSTKITTFIEGIKKDRVITPVELLARLNIPLVRVKGLTKLGIDTIDTFLSYDDKGTAIGKNVVEWKEKDYNIDLLNDLIATVEIIVEEKDDKVGLESKGKVCATGSAPMGRKELQKIIAEKGYEWHSSVTKDLNILLVDDVNGSSSKIVKARKNGTTIMLYEEFLNDM
jgi:DNA ligase (NAD+)